MGPHRPLAGPAVGPAARGKRQERGAGAGRGGRTAAWALLGAGLLASGASSAFGLYETFWWFDEALHCYFSFALTLVLALHAYDALLTGRRRHEVLLVLTLAGLGLAFGTVWEMVEWVYDLFLPTDAILGKRDTMIDLALDAVGGLAAGVVGVRMLR